MKKNIRKHPPFPFTYQFCEQGLPVRPCSPDCTCVIQIVSVTTWILKIRGYVHLQTDGPESRGQWNVGIGDSFSPPMSLCFKFKHENEEERSKERKLKPFKAVKSQPQSQKELIVCPPERISHSWEWM